MIHPSFVPSATPPHPVAAGVFRRVLAVIVAATAVAAFAEQPAAVVVPAVVFDGFGLDDFTGAGSIAAALRKAAPQPDDDAVPLDIVVRGPTGSQAMSEMLATEIRSRIESLGFSAGVVATPDVIHEGLATWVGGVRVESAHETGREVLELRTSLTQAHESGVFGIELGPRIERRLRRGAVLFLDGKAEAKALKSIETGAWSLPGTSNDAMVGVTARTGLSR